MMRSTGVFALFLLCCPSLAACSGAGQATSALPLAVASNTSTTQSEPSASAPQLALPSTTERSASTLSSGVADATPGAGANFTFPADFPANAVSGARTRLSSVEWDEGGASSPVVSLDGPGSVGAESFVYLRADNSAAVGVYFPSPVTVATGWLRVNLGVSDRLPLMSTADASAKWSDTRPGFKASTSFYFTPTRTLLIDLIGNGSSASPQPTAAASPTPRATSGSGGCPHFVSNPICHTLPSQPNVSAYSNTWASLDFQAGRNYMPSFNAKVGPKPFSDSNDSSDPPLDELSSGSASIAQVIDCDQSSWGLWACGRYGIQGKTLRVPAEMAPAGNSDHHYSFSDDGARGEYDFWLVRSLPGSPGATLHMGSGGFCSWSGDGTACSGSNATNIAGSLGSITEADFVRAEADATHGNFGHAISFASLCTDPSFVYPANASDGTNSNGSSACKGHTGSHQRPPEGTRLFLDLSDEQIDAMNLPAYAKAWWRTLDREHEGGIITDTNWYGAPGLSAAYQRDDFSTQAREAGVSPVPYARVPIAIGTIDLAHDIKFCANGTC